MERVTLEIDITGPDGNIFFILAKVRQIMQRQRRITEYNELWEQIQKGNYSRALYLINQKVELIDISENKLLIAELKKGKQVVNNE